MQTCGTYHTENLQRTFMLCIGFALVNYNINYNPSWFAIPTAHAYQEEVVYGHVNRVKITLAKFRC